MTTEISKKWHRKLRDRITHHKDDERQWKQYDKQVEMSRVYEQILLENIKSAAERGEQRVEDLTIRHDRGLVVS